MHLQQNDLVALVSPAGQLSDPQIIVSAQKLLKKWGLRSYVGRYALNRNGHFAGNDQQRLEDFQAALDHPEVKLIWALRGGYGSIRIVDELDFTKFKKQPKLVAGFSDITIIHQKIQKLGFESLHAFMPVQLKNKIPQMVVKQTKNALFGRPVSYSFNKHPQNTSFNVVKGTVTGGNLATLYSLLGTGLAPDTHHKILFIEDVSEPLYAIDRMMIALKKAGKLQDLKALLVGQFTQIPPNTPGFGQSLYEIILTHTQGKYPIIFDAPIGHVTQNYPLIFGRELILTQDNSNVYLHQPASNHHEK